MGRVWFCSRQWLCIAGAMLGCAASQPGPPLSDVEFSTVQIRNEPASPSPIRASGATVATSDRPDAEPPDAAIERVAFSEPIGDELRPAPALADDDPAVSTDVVVESVVLPLSLDSVIGSVYQRYPLLQYALYSRNIAVGEQVAARGEFDLKLKGASENGPTGFYQTYRQSVGVVQPLYGGGEVFAGYRIGRGDFQPWYQERQTNDGGEFKAGVGVPLLQNTEIDPRRAALWQAQYGRNLAEPEIQAQLISFVQEASYAYWTWISAGANYHIAERVLRLAEDRTGRIQSQVEAGLIDPPELTDNLRLVAERQAKLADARRKLDQSAAKLSLYLRDAGGRPLVPDVSQLTDFPDPDPDTVHSRDAEISLALESRPELKSLDWQRRQIEVEYAQAENLTLPDLDAVVSGSQDVGQPTSKKRDKSEFELEASLYLDVPLQRRKARGKMTALEGKLAQLSAKRRMTADKIAVDVQYAQFALDAALQQVYHMREAVRLAEELAERERQNFQLGLSDLLKVTLREQYAAESALKAVDSLLQYYEAEADLRAAMGLDRLPDQP